MKAIAFLATAMLLAMGAAAADGDEDFGTARGDSATGCIATARNIEQFPQDVQLVKPEGALESGQFPGRIISRLGKRCEGLYGGDEEDLSFYAVKLLAPQDGVWYAVANFAGVPASSMRSCTGIESLNFTVWGGVPGRSTRLWHGNAGLGYDTEASCNDELLPE